MNAIAFPQVIRAAAVLFALVVSVGAGVAQQVAKPEAGMQPRGFLKPNLNAICGGGKKTSQGCDAIKARPILDAARAPWRAIGRVNFASVQIRQHCTGTLVSERVVLTAAHCLYNHARKQWIPADSLRFVAGYQRGSYEAVSSGVRYVLDSSQDIESRSFRAGVAQDWALLLLEDPIGQTTGYLPLAPSDRSDGTAARYSLAGYSGLRSEVLSSARDCGVPQKGGPQNILLQRCSVMQGDSGAPLLVERDGELLVIGLLSAVGITKLGFTSFGVASARYEQALRSLTTE